jgi:hypothetical protein
MVRAWMESKNLLLEIAEGLGSTPIHRPDKTPNTNFHSHLQLWLRLKRKKKYGDDEVNDDIWRRVRVMPNAPLI